MSRVETVVQLVGLKCADKMDQQRVVTTAIILFQNLIRKII